MISFQSKNIIKTYLFLPSFHQETVTVDQKDHTEDHNNNFSCRENHSYFCGMANSLIQRWTVA